MKISELLKNVKTTLLPAGSGDMEISGISINSKEVKKGDLFIALKGSKSDGNDYISEAVKNGAKAVITSGPKQDFPVPFFFADDMAGTLSAIAKNFYGNPSSKMEITGLTGTKGKTTSSYILEAMLTHCGFRPGLIGTINYRTHKRVLSKASNTTPLAPELNRLLAEMLADGCSHCVMEVSSHSLALKRVEDIEFDSAVFTNFQSDHLDFHKTREEYFSAKARLMDLLARSPKKNRLAAVNADDEALVRLPPAGTGIRTVTYGLKKTAEFRAEKIEIYPDKTSFEINREGKKHKFRLPLIGVHNVYNALSAIAVLNSRGIAMEKLAEAASKIENVPGRLEKIVSSADFVVYVDYAHTEESLRNVLSTLEKIPHKRILTVFGCGGDRDKGKRAPMGETACSMSGHVIITSDNPRTEDPEAIISDIEKGIKNRFSNYELVSSREEAIFKAVIAAESGDIILIAGKGHEDYQILSDRTIHFDDRETALKFMRVAGKL